MNEAQTSAGTAFKEAYSILNSEQKKAVDTIEGPVMVIAGPGTGKTQVLTLRIANILLKTDTAPEQILALTFTEAGAKAMRERLHRFVGTAAYRVPIHTFHGFASGLIAQFPESYEHVIGGRPASEIDKIRIFEQLLDSPELKVIRTLKSPYHNLGKIKDIISKLKQEYITPDKFSVLLDTQAGLLNDIEQFHTKGAHKGKERKEYRDAAKNLEKNQELLAVYQQYEALLHKEKLFDYDDMLVETVNALKADEHMRLEVQETYQYVLADEHQDVNGVQNELLNVIVSFHDSPNIFAVGDEKQAIYRFQGASLENFLLFANTYNNCTQISLTKNYRSAQSILDISHELIKVEDGPLKDLRIPLDSQLSTSPTIEKREFSHQAVEDDWVVAEVLRQLESGVPEDEIAILVRNNYSVEELSAKLRRAGVAVAASAESDILTHAITESIVQLMTVVAEPHNDAAWFTILNTPYCGVAMKDVATLMQARSFNQPLAALIAAEVEKPALELSTYDALSHLYEVILKAKDTTLTEAPHRTLEYLIKESGLLEQVIKADAANGTRIVRRFYDEVERLVISREVKSIADVLRALRTYQEYGLALDAPYINTNESAVSVMSVHKSKGLEFTTVILPRLNDKSWGGGTKRRYFDVPLARYEFETSADREADEERLLYVALTRAKQNIYLSYAETNQEGSEFLESRLLDRLPEKEVLVLPTDTEEKAFDAVQGLGDLPDTTALDSEMLSTLFKAKGFSATSLNNYLSSPYTYLYQNLLLIPQLQATPLQFGSVVHDVLERIVKYQVAESAFPSVTAIKGWIEGAMQRLPLSQQEYTAMHEHALEAVVGYTGEISGSWPKNMQVEKKFEVQFETGLQECPSIRLTGKFDRIDFDENGKAIGVVDYKTGKPKSRNDIEGNTKASDGNYKRQLVFYALLLDLYDDERYQTRNMTLSFVEPNASGKYKEETFAVTDEEVESLRQEIVEATKQIVSGQAWQTPCDETVCEYCHLLPS